MCFFPILHRTQNEENDGIKNYKAEFFIVEGIFVCAL